ncbi:hypothetical protein K2P97_05805 [bacterium]|nr:hypothetical protein [bacterium]
MKMLILSILLVGSISQARVAHPACEERVGCSAASNSQIYKYRDLIYDVLLQKREKINLSSQEFQKLSEGDKYTMQLFRNDASLAKSVKFIDEAIDGTCNCNETLDFLSTTLYNVNQLSK